MKAITLVIMTLFLTCAFGQGLLEDDSTIDAYVDKFSDGIPTKSIVANLKSQAINAFNSGDCQTAIPQLERWATEGNSLANFYSQTLEPFYDASYSDREDFYISSIGPLVDNEGTSNELKRDRNTAWIYLGECHAKLGDNVRALSYFSKSLDRLSIDSDELDNWQRAAQGIIKIIDQ